MRCWIDDGERCQSFRELCVESRLQRQTVKANESERQQKKKNIISHMLRKQRVAIDVGTHVQLDVALKEQHWLVRDIVEGGGAT